MATRESDDICYVDVLHGINIFVYGVVVGDEKNWSCLWLVMTIFDYLASRVPTRKFEIGTSNLNVNLYIFR